MAGCRRTGRRFGPKTIISYDGIVYKVTSSGKKTLAVSDLMTDLTEVTIPATMASSGVTYKVTAISGRAFKNRTSLKSVSIGKNVRVIGSEAFYGDKNLKKIKFSSAKNLRKVKADAFKGVSAKAKVTCEKGQASSLRKTLIKAGLPKTADVFAVTKNSHSSKNKSITFTLTSGSFFTKSVNFKDSARYKVKMTVLDVKGSSNGKGNFIAYETKYDKGSLFYNLSYKKLKKGYTATSSGTKRGMIFFDVFDYEIPAGISSIKIRLTFIPA